MRWAIKGPLLSAAVFGALAVLPVTAPGLSPAQAASPMTFRIAPAGNVRKCGARCPKIILAEGEIALDTPDRFLDFVRRNVRDKSVKAVVLMNSPGGVVVASMRLGVLFRRAGAAVIVARMGGITPNGEPVFASANCASACVYALMGARKRVVPPQSRLVIHRMFAYETFGGTDNQGPQRQKVYRNSQLYGELSRYARTMGVSPEVIRQAESLPAEQVKVISQAEIRRWRLAVPKL